MHNHSMRAPPSGADDILQRPETDLGSCNIMMFSHGKALVAPIRRSENARTYNTTLRQKSSHEDMFWLNVLALFVHRGRVIVCYT